MGEERRGSNLRGVIGKRRDSWFRTKTETETNTHYPLLLFSSSSSSLSFSRKPLFQSLRLCFISKTDLTQPDHAKRNSHLLGLPLQFPILFGEETLINGSTWVLFFSALPCHQISPPTPLDLTPVGICETNLGLGPK